MSNNVFINNGMIMDGTGKPAFKANIAISGDRIENVGQFEDKDASITIDAEGLVVAPGFIDVHSHLDFFLPSPRHAEVLKTWIQQGVTTIVSGNCGFSPAPINHEYEETISTYWNFALPHDGLKYEWTTMAEFFDFLEKNGLALNAAILTGHNTLRTNVMGFQSRFANSQEISEMKRMLRESLDAGSIGLSLGLEYIPGIFSNTDEILELASVMTEYNTPLVPHTRGLFSKLYAKAIKEVIFVAEKNNIPLQISHQCGGGIGRIRKLAIKAIEMAIDRGVKIGHDNIPVPNSSSTVLLLFPPWLFDGGMEKFFKRIQDPNIREQAENEMKKFVPKWPPWENKWWTGREYNHQLYLCGFQKEKNHKFETMKINDIAKELNKDPFDAFIDLVIEERGKLFYISGQFYNEMAEDFVYDLLSDPNCSLGTDIVGTDFKTISPVAYGAFTKVLGQMSRDKGIMPQEEAVRKMTSLSSQQMGLKDRGIIEKGAYADITIFNPKTVKCNSSYTNPYQPSEGIEYVLINGKMVLEKGSYNADAFAGRVLRRCLKTSSP
ncbi:amidohydrolase family protein, partial [candidate division WOR-3 bacterium]|nr:amidohydrolase family protein [candidate division WOR-3 bacterium]